MDATIKINMDNAAFEENPGLELKIILEKLARVVNLFNYNQDMSNTIVYDEPLYDSNGNRVGTVFIE